PTPRRRRQQHRHDSTAAADAFGAAARNVAPAYTSRACCTVTSSSPPSLSSSPANGTVMSSRNRQYCNRRSAVSRSAINASWHGNNGQESHTELYQAPAVLSFTTTSNPEANDKTVIGCPNPPCVRVETSTASAANCAVIDSS